MQGVVVQRLEVKPVVEVIGIEGLAGSSASLARFASVECLDLDQARRPR
jgi:hypothetical protein